MNMLIYIASTAESKVDAAKQAFSDISSPTFIPMAIASRVSDQPVGERETRQGAFNRLRTLQSHIITSQNIISTNNTPIFALSIENGLMKQGDGTWHDVAVIMLCNMLNGHETLTYSAGIPTDFQGMDDLERYQNLLRRFKGFQPNDVTGAFTNGRVTRTDILTQAIEVARGRLECNI